MESVDLGKIRFIKLNENSLHLTAGFECDDEDLNEFLKEDAIGYYINRLAVTYLVVYGGKTIGFFCLSDDGIKINEEDLIKFEKKGKRLPNYPAIKIGRLAVLKEYRGKGVGSYIIKHIVGRADVHSREVGCRYLTVDSYAREENLNFYRRNDFKSLVDSKKRKNIPMYYDLIEITG